VARVGRAVVFPARFQLVAAMNPCPCGWDEDPSGRCACPSGIPERYRGRISGPLRDRIDLWVGVPRVAPRELLSAADAESSEVVRARVGACRVRQLEARAALNGRLRGRALRAAAALDARGEALAIALADSAGLTARATERPCASPARSRTWPTRTAWPWSTWSEAARYRPPGDGRTGVARGRPDDAGDRTRRPAGVAAAAPVSTGDGLPDPGAGRPRPRPARADPLARRSGACPSARPGSSSPPSTELGR
jgi:hypothetical protein